MIFSVGLALAGVLTGAGFGQATIQSLRTLTIDALAAILVGGTAIAGGYGSPWRSAAGAVLIAVISNVMVLNDFSTGGRLAVQGAVVVVVVVRSISCDGARRPADASVRLRRARSYAAAGHRPRRHLDHHRDDHRTFRGEASVYSVLEGFPLLGLVALGLAITIIAGELDLSVGSMAALAGVMAVKTSEAGLVGAVLIAVAVGIVIGSLQGWMIARLAINSLVLRSGR